MGIRIIVVDDSAIIRAVVKKNLTLSGLKLDDVQEAPDGAAALTAIRARGVDVVFTDIHMPNMTGIELVEALRKDPRYRMLPVFVISSDRSEGSVEALRGLGIQGFLTKPFKPETFKALIDSALSDVRKAHV